MHAATRGYTLLKVIGRAEGLEEFRKELSVRFAKPRRATNQEKKAAWSGFFFLWARQSAFAGGGPRVCAAIANQVVIACKRLYRFEATRMRLPSH